MEYASKASIHLRAEGIPSGKSAESAGEDLRLCFSPSPAGAEE